MFSHVPDDDGIDRTLADGRLDIIRPGASTAMSAWMGLEDVRDHYVERPFGVDAGPSRGWIPSLARARAGGHRLTMARMFGIMPPGFRDASAPCVAVASDS
jgi:hypothetical protein